MSYNNPDNLVSKFKSIGEQYTDNDIQDELDRAKNKLDSNVGRKFVEYIRSSKENQEIFNLGFSKLISFDKVRIRGRDTPIDPSNYTEDTDKGIITFNTEYAEDNIDQGLPFIFYYTPEIFKHLEILYAVKFLAQGTTLQTRNGETSINLEEIKEEINNLENDINKRVGNALAVDHQPRFPSRAVR